jgi:hypothetical protein
MNSFVKLVLRILIFQNILTISIFQLKDSKVSSIKLKERLLDVISKLNIKIENKTYHKFIENQVFFELGYKIFLSIMIATSILSILLNRSFYKFICAIQFLFLTLIIYNPLLPESIIESNNIYGIRKELILNVALFLGILVNCFTPKQKQINSK